MGGVAKSTKNRSKIVQNGVLGGPGAHFCSKLGPKVKIVDVRRAFWVKNGPPRGPQNLGKLKKMVPRFYVFLDRAPKLILERFGVENVPKIDQN